MTDRKTFRTGESMRLVCDMSERKLRDYEWLKEGRSIEADGAKRVMEQNGRVLVLNEMTKADKGKWSCQVKSRFGTHQASTKLTYIG